MSKRNPTGQKGFPLLAIILFCFSLSLAMPLSAADPLDSLGDDLFGPTTTEKKEEPKTKEEKKAEPEKKKEAKAKPASDKPTLKRTGRNKSAIESLKWTDDEVEKITVVKDGQGWKIQINGKDFFIKGIEWSPTPVGENYSYSLWDQDEKVLKEIVDRDMTFFKNAGINSIRTFTMPPPKWIYYIYKTYGIRIMINDMMGRYGMTVRGRWVFPTDYSDPEVRAALKEQAIGVIEKYKNVPGVLFFFFGNESNYGLEWKSTEIENLPVGERHAAKARFLYSMWEEVMKESKTRAPHIPTGIVNGDIQYIDLIKELCPSLDVLGANVYRGVSATDLWERVKKILDKPFVFTEFGCDAFNARTGEEDQYHQAFFLKQQWKEIYRKSYGKGEEQIAIGGFTFGWLDGWWKYQQTANLEIQDKTASWGNGGYWFDYVPGKNNMNEEWWGIAAMSPKLTDGVNGRVPRAAYYLISDINRLDPLAENTKTIEQYFEGLNLSAYVSMGEANTLKSSVEDLRKVRITGGNLTSDMVVNASELSPAAFSKGLNASLNFGFQPMKELTGSLSVNMAALASDRLINGFYYGDRIKPKKIYTNTSGISTNSYVSVVNNNFEIYSAAFAYDTDKLTLKGFYHVGHEPWMYEGDFFGFLPESYDMFSPDLWNAKAPFGMEFIGKKALEGLKVIGGPEVSWGANPKVMAKYQRNIGFADMAIIHSEDIAEQTPQAGQAAGVLPKTRKSSIYLKVNKIPKVDLEIGGLWSGSEKIGRTFSRAIKSSGQGYLGSGYDIIINDSIKLLDTLGTRIAFNANPVSMMSVNGEFNLCGLVADAGALPGLLGSTIGAGGTGNKIEYKGGMNFYLGFFQVYLKYRNRTPLVPANPQVTGYVLSNKIYPDVRPRNPLDDPFAVIGNREGQTFEIVFVYEPTGATWFFDWDNEMKEDAKIAASVNFNYSIYPTFTDSGTYNNNGLTTPFGVGLPPANVWEVSSRIVSNPIKDLKLIANLSAGLQQSTGGATNLVQYYSGSLTAGYKGIRLSGSVKKDAWGGNGVYDWYRQWNLTYPWQFSADLSYVFAKSVFVPGTSRIGIRAAMNLLDEENEAYANNGSYMLESSLYYTMIF